MIALSRAFTLNCDFGYVNWTMVGRRYTCNVLSIDFMDENRVQALNLTGNHIDEHSNDEVEGIQIFHENFDGVFPRGLNEFFPNLVTIGIHNSGIQELTLEDMSAFPHLLMIVLPRNQIEELDGDVFDGNPKMTCINLNFNRIRHLGPRVFSKMPDLMALRLSENFCIDQQVEMNPSGIPEIIWNATVQCPSSINQIEKEIMNGEHFQGIISSLTNQIEVLEQRLSSLENVEIEETATTSSD
jgi:hypothetical protein